MDPLTFFGTVQRVSTVSIGGARVSIDIPENDLVSAAKMMALMSKNVKVTIEIVEEQ